MKISTHQPRGYTLPVELINAIDAHTTNRSLLITKSVREALENPQKLVETLKKRLETEQSDLETKRITINISSKSIKELAELTRKAQLGTEHVLRLAVESHLEDMDQST